MNASDVIAHFGSGAKAAEVLGVTHQCVYAWRRNGIPVGRQYQIELMTEGALRAERPPAADASVAAA